MREYGTPLIDAFATSGAGGHRDSRSSLAPLPREAAGVAEHGELGDVPAEEEPSADVAAARDAKNVIHAYPAALVEGRPNSAR